MRLHSLSLLLAAAGLLTGLQTVKAQKVVLHMAGNQTFECNISQLDSISFEETDAPAPKVRAAIYETIPGYEVRDVVFYTDDMSSSPQTVFTLYATEGQSPFTIELGTLSNNTLGAYSTNATFAGNADNDYYTTYPPLENKTSLTIKCDYKLVSSDGSGEIINVKGAKATIPSTCTRWEVNKSYTYLFKISYDYYSAATGELNINAEDLFPIILDVVVVDVADDIQNEGTQATAYTPYVMVYQAGDVNVYQAGDVEVIAMEGTSNITNECTWAYVELEGTDFNFAWDYEKLGAYHTETDWTYGSLTKVRKNKTYVIKLIYTQGSRTCVAYYVLKVS